MKYDLKAFNDAVDYYQSQLKNLRNKDIFIIFEAKNDKAFFSIAPLSRALHNLGCELNIRGLDGPSKSLDAINDVWDAFDDLNKGIKNNKTIALNDFINEADKKAKGEIRKIFKRADIFIIADDKGFIITPGDRKSVV
jgi:hypothetical protein